MPPGKRSRRGHRDSYSRNQDVSRGNSYRYGTRQGTYRGTFYSREQSLADRSEDYKHTGALNEHSAQLSRPTGQTQVQGNTRRDLGRQLRTRCGKRQQHCTNESVPSSSQNESNNGASIGILLSSSWHHVHPVNILEPVLTDHPSGQSKEWLSKAGYFIV